LEDLAQSRALFVQPHLDDVAFACGGMVARAAAAGDKPIAIGVFTGAPNANEPLGETSARCTRSGASAMTPGCLGVVRIDAAAR